jgi:hypothetical protein
MHLFDKSSAYSRQNFMALALVCFVFMTACSVLSPDMATLVTSIPARDEGQAKDVAMPNDEGAVWLAAGLRTPFVGVDGPFAHRDSLALSVPVVQAMAPQASGPIDFAVWGSVVLNLAYANLAREVWHESKLDPHVPTFTTIMQCSTSMVGAFDAAGIRCVRIWTAKDGNSEFEEATIDLSKGERGDVLSGRTRSAVSLDRSGAVSAHSRRM